MRAILAIVMAGGLAWGGYWFVGSSTLEREVNAWLDQQQDAPLSVRRDAVVVKGFPNRFDVTVTGPSLYDQASGWGWKAPFLQVYSMTWKPWHVLAALPPSQQITLHDGREAELRSTHVRGSLLLKPGLDLALREAVVEGKDLQLDLPEGGAWGLDSLVLAAGLDATRADGLRLGVQASNLRPDPARLAEVADLGPVVAEAHLDLTLNLTAPIDRHLAERADPPGITAAHLTDLHLAWGPLILTARGGLDRGADGLAMGQIDLTVEDWPRLPPALVALGLLPARNAAFVARGLSVLAEQAGTGDRLEVALVMKDGAMTLGGLPLGPAPRLP